MHSYLRPREFDAFFRSLVTTLRAAEMFDVSHLSSPDILPLVEGAKAYYVGGFFLTHGVKSALEIAQKAANAGKVGRPLLKLLGAR